jgi:hypothetical protein
MLFYVCAGLVTVGLSNRVYIRFSYIDNIGYIVEQVFCVEF